MSINIRKIVHPAASLLIAGALFALSCSSSKNPVSYGDNNNNNPPPVTHSAKYHSVAIQGFAFSPSGLAIAVGDTIVWTNGDSAPHTVTSDTGNTLASPTLAQGQAYQHIFPTVGTFAYHCSIHTTMHASVTVQ